MGWLYVSIYIIGVLIGQVIWGYRDPQADTPGFILAMAWPLILPFVGPYWICVYFFRYGRKLAKKEGRYSCNGDHHESHIFVSSGAMYHWLGAEAEIRLIG